MVVRPPALFPGEGLLSGVQPNRPVYHSHQRIRSINLSAIAGVRALRVNNCSAPKISVVSPRIVVPPQATNRSLATPSAAFAVIPELPSEPPQFSPSTISLAGTVTRRAALTCG